MDDVNPLDVRLVRADDTNPWHGLDNLGLHDPLLLKLLLLKLLNQQGRLKVMLCKKELYLYPL